MNQNEPTTLVAALGSSFAGEAWKDISIGSSNWLSGTWFHSKNNTSASAVVSFTDWSSEPPFDGGLNTNALVDQAKTVNVEVLGLWRVIRAGSGDPGAVAIATHQHNSFSDFNCERPNAPGEGLQSIVFLVSPPGYDPGTL